MAARCPFFRWFPVVFVVAGLAVAHGATNEELDAIGVLNVKTLGVKGDGVADDTAAINRAIQQASAEAKVLLFPESTYLVSDTIRGEIAGKMTPNGKGKLTLNSNTGENPVALVGSTSGTTPVIKLKDKSDGFGSSAPDGRKPIVRIQAYLDENGNGQWDSGESDGSANLFSCGIRNMKIVNGSGNPGAVGLDFDGSQGCVVENIDIDFSNGGFAGMDALIGQGGVFGRVKITGGKYGIYAAITKYPAINGLELIDQTEAAIYNKNTWLLLQVTGFRIRKSEAPAIITETRDHALWNHLSLVDGTIEFDKATDSPAIDNAAGRTVTLKNVYVKNASQIVKSDTYPTVAGNADGRGWVKVDEYSAPAVGFAKNAIDGMVNKDMLESVTRDYSEDDVPQDLCARHLWNPLDWPSPDVILANANKGVPGYAVLPVSLANGFCSTPMKNHAGEDLSLSDPDATETLQELIDNNRHVLIPKGKFMINKTIELRDDTVLQGVWNSLAGLSTFYLKWKPTEADYTRDANGDGFLDGDTAMVRSPSSAAARTKMGDLSLRFSGLDLENDWFMSFAWRSGEQSMLKGIRSRYMTVSIPKEGNPKNEFAFLGPHVGGRVYACGVGNSARTVHPGHRRVLVHKGTDNDSALLFYNLNTEDGLGNAQFRIVDSKNIAIYGSKMEDRPLIEWLNSENCAYFGANGLDITLGKPGDPSMDCENMYVANSNGAVVQVRESFKGEDYKTDIAKGLGVFRRGACDFTKFHVVSEDEASPISGE